MPKAKEAGVSEPGCKENQYLGYIETVINGAQYYDVEIGPGEALTLEREPSNSHDPKAIRVENQHFEKAGYVPRRVASWLAPLIDDGKVVAEAFSPAAPRERLGKPALDLSLYLAPKGMPILQEDDGVGNLGSALHQVVRHAYTQCVRWEAPHAVTTLGERLGEAFKRDALPETRMLLNLMPHQARRLLEGKGANDLAALQSRLRTLRIGEPLQHRNLTIFPLGFPEDSPPAAQLLQEAIEAGTAVVSETSDTGSVPELLLRNRGEIPVLILEGEIVTGAKQNRVVNISVLAAPGAELVLPVSCVEEGRWASVSPTLSATHCAPPKLRARRNRRVQENLVDRGMPLADQGEVWQDVNECLRSAAVDSPTASLVDGYEATRASLDGYRKDCLLPEDAAGVVVAINGKLVSMDLFDSRDTCQKVWARLSEACFFQAAHVRPRRKRPGSEDVAAFIEQFAGALVPSIVTAGEGTAFRVNNDELTGSVLCYQKKLLHAAVFKV